MNEMKIIVPEGMEIDMESIKFRSKKKTYEDVAKKLFSDDDCYYIGQHAEIYRCCVGVGEHISKYPNNCTTEKQAEKLLAINKLMNVAKYLNDGWQPNWEDINELKFCINIMGLNTISICNVYHSQSLHIYFKSKELAQKAIEILGEETIRLALCTDW